MGQGVPEAIRRCPDVVRTRAPARGEWELYRGSGVLALAGLMVAALLFSFAYLLTVERAMMRFRSLRPQYCSIYDPYFWWHERYWKLLTPFVGMFGRGEKGRPVMVPPPSPGARQARLPTDCSYPVNYVPGSCCRS